MVLNTCTVTASADQDARAAIRRVHRENPRLPNRGHRLLRPACPRGNAALPGVTQVIGNSHKHQLAEIVLRSRRIRSASLRCEPALGPLSHGAMSQLTKAEQPIFVSDIFAHTELLAAPVFDCSDDTRTRPNLKVQDGCDNRCSFCVIPSVRGQSRSLPLSQILREVNALVAPATAKS